MNHYQKPPELYDGLRLHQNENTGGCSPRVLDALATLRADQICFYPPYAEATSAIATYLGVPADRITLLNGLDEGIMALAVVVPARVGRRTGSRSGRAGTGVRNIPLRYRRRRRHARAGDAAARFQFSAR